MGFDFGATGTLTVSNAQKYKATERTLLLYIEDPAER
jgi:hypothetical protein